MIKRKHRTDYTEEQLVGILTDYMKNGLPVMTLAEKYNVNYMTARKWVKKSGLPVNRQRRVGHNWAYIRKAVLQNVSVRV